jgi:hypothetical protein
MNRDMMNRFCGKYDLIFLETGRVNGMDVYFFEDFQGTRRFYMYPEIVESLDGRY